MYLKVSSALGEHSVFSGHVAREFHLGLLNAYKALKQFNRPEFPDMVAFFPKAMCYQ